MRSSQRNLNVRGPPQTLSTSRNRQSVMTTSLHWKKEGLTHTRPNEFASGIGVGRKHSKLSSGVMHQPEGWKPSTYAQVAVMTTEHVEASSSICAEGVPHVDTLGR